MDIGAKDRASVLPDGRRARPLAITGVEVVELSNVLTRSGSVMELYRTDWPTMDFVVQQVTWQQLNPGGVTDWHRHADQIDRLIGVEGNIKLALFDGREDSDTRGASEIVRLGALRPVMVVVPAGVWHGLRNESGAPAGYINVLNTRYNHPEPDNWRTQPGIGIPDIL